MTAGQLEEKSADEVVTDESNKNWKADSDENEEVETYGHDSESDYDDNSDDVEIDVIDSLSAIIKTQSIMIAPHFFGFIS